MAPAPSRTIRPALPLLLLALTAVAGLVDAVSYLGLGHIFTANMTGNVVFLGFAVAGAQGLSVARSFTALVAFLAGAVIGGRLAARMSTGPEHHWTRVAFGGEAALLLVSAVLAIGSGSSIAGSTLTLVIVL